jgi:hypothetical protein
MKFGWLVIICETYFMECHLVFVRTRTCGYLVMIYGCDLNLLILWLVLVLVVILRLTLDQFYWIYIYMWLLP